MAHDSTNLVKTRAFGSVTRKAVMLVLADYTDAEWSTFVGQKRCAAEAEVSERTVRSVLAEFEKQGLISRTHRGREGERGGRTSDRIQLHRDQIARLPAAFAAKPETEPATGAVQTATDGGSNGKAVAGEQSVEQSVEHAAGDVSDLPPVRWAKRWAEMRRVTFTATVRRSWSAQIQEILRAGGVITEGLLQQALREGIREPKGWAWVQLPEPPPPDCDVCNNQRVVMVTDSGELTDWDDPEASTAVSCPECARSA